MSKEADEENRSEQTSQVFALLTAKLEDAAILALDGQAPQTDKQLIDLAGRTAETAGEPATMAGELHCLLSQG